MIRRTRLDPEVVAELGYHGPKARDYTPVADMVVDVSADEVERMVEAARRPGKTMTTAAVFDGELERRLADLRAFQRAVERRAPNYPVHTGDAMTPGQAEAFELTCRKLDRQAEVDAVIHPMIEPLSRELRAHVWVRLDPSSAFVAAVRRLWREARR